MPIVKSVLMIDEAIVGVQLQDRISVPTKRTLTDAGQMHVPCKFARTGSQLYTAKQLKLDGVEPDKIITVHRDEASVFDDASMESFRSAPVTIGHPKNAAKLPVKVTAANAKDYQVGMLEGMPTRDEDTLGGTLVLSAQEAIDALEDGTQELSAGYTCDIEEVDGKFYQRNIVANHIAIVAKGRAGSSCRISDEAILVADEETLISAKVIEEKSETLTVDEVIATHKVEMADAAETHKVAVEALNVLIADATAKVDKSEVVLEAMKVELADAKVAASEGVIERCEAIENARLIADMRDLGDKSVAEIHTLVVTDQMSDKDFKGKSPEYMAAMFEILVDASKGETPMGKLLKQQDLNDESTKVKAPVDKVKDARTKMIKTSKELSNKTY